MANPDLDLTIIIPNYNTRRLVRNCINSVYRLTKDITFEIICIDGNSPDGSAAMIFQQFPDVILIRNNSNESYSRSVNQGLRIARGRYACLLDSDTMLVGNAFRSLVEFMDGTPEAAACGPKLLNADGTLQHHIRRFAGVSVFLLQTLNWHKLFPKSRIMARYYATDFDFSRAQQVEAIGTTAFVLRRSTWEVAGLLDERFRWAMADLAYEYMLREKGYKLFYTPCAEVIHFGSQTVNQDVLKTLREQCHGFIHFSDAYNYFGSGRLTKVMVRMGIWMRYYLKVLGYYVSSDKRVIKGPGRPTKEQAQRIARLIDDDPVMLMHDRRESPIATFSQSGVDAN